MKNILVFNDFSPEAEHATEIGLLLAGQMKVNLYVWNVLDKHINPVIHELITADGYQENIESSTFNTNWIVKLESNLNLENSTLPHVQFIEDVDYASELVLSIVRKHDIGLLIRGITSSNENLLEIETEVLNCATKSGCPVLFIPDTTPHKSFEKIAYATDLRFCRRDIVSFLSQLAQPFNASILIANISAKGLPYMEDNYAKTVFTDTVLTNKNMEHMYFSNIRERDIPRALDVLVNGMNNDLLVLVNNRFHFNEMFGHQSPYIVPNNIHHTPILVFPS